MNFYIFKFISIELCIYLMIKVQYSIFGNIFSKKEINELIQETLISSYLPNCYSKQLLYYAQ